MKKETLELCFERKTNRAHCDPQKEAEKTEIGAEKFNQRQE